VLPAWPFEGKHGRILLMERAVQQAHPEIEHGISAWATIQHRLAQSLFDRRYELLWNCAASDLVDEDETRLTFRQRLERQANPRHLPEAAPLLSQRVVAF